MEKLPEIQIPLPLGIKGIRIIGVKENNGSLIITLQKDLDFGLCPACGRISQKVKDCHIHGVTDRPIFENQTKIEILKRRWKCLNDFCEVNTFTEETEGLPRRWTHTEPFYQEAYELSRRMTYTEVYNYLQEKACKISLSMVYKRSQQELHRR